MREKLTSVEIESFEFQGGRHDTKVRIEEDARLVVDWYDIGPRVEELTGDSDYERYHHVPADWKDTVLLLLIQEKFKSEKAVVAWLKENGIPYQFSSWN